MSDLPYTLYSHGICSDNYTLMLVFFICKCGIDVVILGMSA